MTSYTDEQVRDIFKHYPQGHSIVESLLADRTRLQAEVKDKSARIRFYMDASHDLNEKVESLLETMDYIRRVAERGQHNVDFDAIEYQARKAIDSDRAKKGDV